jgi:phosphoribosyl-AMP cyclohydrolase
VLASPGITIITTIPIGGGRTSKQYSNSVSKMPAAVSWRAFLLVYAMILDFSKLDGLVPAVIQDVATGRVLMVGFMNEEAYRKTVETGFATFFSRSRNKLWLKGETSGHRLVVKSISTDCDRDCVLVQVEALGPGVCHNGYTSCFYRSLQNGEWVESEEPSYDPGVVYGSNS